nr:MAG TPA: protein of unknown function (DUF5554) [Caudoviricetes sp.]
MQKSKLLFMYLLFLFCRCYPVNLPVERITYGKHRN